MQAARSRARASCNRSPAGRTGARGPPCPGPGIATAVTTGSPRDHVVREVVDLPRDVLAEQVVEGQQVIEDLQVDRKSTRLNSSHGYISYAVFCLKKKKKIQSYMTHMS